MTTCNVLVSSAGRRVALLSNIRCDLDELGVSGDVSAADMSPLSAAVHRARRYVQVPPVAHESFAEAVADACRRHDIALVVPTIDTELEAYAGLRGRLADIGTLVLASGRATVAISSDKRRTAAWLGSQGLPTVRQWDLDEAKDLAGSLPYPVIVKPAKGSASIGVRRVTREAELLVLDDGELVVQEVAPGDEYTVDVWVDRQGGVRCAVPRRRIEVRAGEVSKGVTEAHEAVIRTAGKVAAALPDAFGPVTIQVFAVAGSPDVKVIEINPRFGGGYPLAWEAGARYPRWAIQEALGWPYDPEEFQWRDGLVMLRYDDAVFLDRAEVGL